LQIEQRGRLGEDGQTQSGSFGPIPFRVAELLELLKDFGCLVGRDTDAGIPDLKPQLSLWPAAADQNAAPDIYLACNRIT
jgi:hypothetical protein